MPQHYTRASILPTSAAAGASTTGSQTSSTTTKTRQYAQLQTQLAQLNANLADTENLVRMTAVQAGDIRFLGGYVGALFMGGAKVLGEEGVKQESADAASTADSGSEGGN